MLCTWYKKNRLTINLKKTKLMLFGTRNMLKSGRKYETRIDGFGLQYVNLGIKLESTLTYEYHASETIRMVAHKLYLLCKIRKYISIQQGIII